MYFVTSCVCNDYDKLENAVILYRFKDDAPVLLQASNDDDGAMTVAIIELQIPRWSAGCAASHTKSACFRSMAADNNRDGLAIEIPRMIQTNRRPGILEEQKRNPCVVTYGRTTPCTWYVFILSMPFEKSRIQWSKEESRATHSNSYTQTFHDDFAREYSHI